MSMTPVGASFLLVAALLLPACSTEQGAVDEPATAGDCTTQIRVGSTVYSSYGATERRARRHTKAERADCQDVGQNARGSVFPEQPELVTAWKIPTYPPEKVLAVRYDRGSFFVFTADSLPASERDQILQELSQRSG